MTSHSASHAQLVTEDIVKSSKGEVSGAIRCWGACVTSLNHKIPYLIFMEIQTSKLLELGFFPC